jgi:cyclopropane fatty-acyl-phospholipid synthase-like methyltransferase
MSFYEKSENVQEYIESCQDYNGESLQHFIIDWVPSGGRLLELGSGPGNDIDFLSQHFQYQGSDCSEPFLAHLRSRFPKLSFQHIDATDFPELPPVDVIYSNKVLHHIEPNDLEDSLTQQKQRLNAEGYLIHTFWLGKGFDVYHGLRFQYYSLEEIEAIFAKDYKVLTVEKYGEFAKNDSLLVIAQRKD